MEVLMNILKTSKQYLAQLDDGLEKEIHLVLGNESCDLDSTIAALGLAFLITKKSDNNRKKLVIPVMNVERNHFALRTETCYLLEKFAINPHLLTFKDQISYQNLIKLKNLTIKTSLVDHHVLSEADKILANTVVEIYDHRPINVVDICQNRTEIRQVIEIVGSCCTLIANEFFNANVPLFRELAHFLYATIIYDTIGLNKEFGKTFDKDIRIAEKLEEIEEIKKESRKELYDKLWQIHNDISKITTEQLLYKDLKFVNKIPVPGLPMLAENFLKRSDTLDALENFARKHKTAIIILIGMDASGEKVQRDIAIFTISPNSNQYHETLIQNLQKSIDLFGADLELTEIGTNSPKTTCFHQGNVKLSRKFIIPIISLTFSE